MAFKYYKDLDNKVYAFEADGSQDTFIKPNLIPITLSEANTLRTITVIPAIVLMVQARQALLQKGYLDQVEAFLSSLEGDVGKAARIDWEFRPTVEKTNSLVQLIKDHLQLTEKQLDELFTLASQL